MKFSLLPVVVFLAAAATSVLGQVDGVNVDDIFERDLTSPEDHLEARDVHTNLALALRELEEVRQRSLDHAYHVKRTMETLERRSRSTCYAACAAQFSGANKIACWKKCDAIWNGKKK
ncbi:hypothetical protein NLJ89_g7970 [Agrocybe chaxingu]|uniref:Uncharacterized protein n=1 Tax=Agrocybe chaxingu TaxID=84603 RepID=A0A9W8MUY6_9AGAR|nr:hypothetical protein NLJ89_g7970 [Agrocybe chaxingu]